MTYDGQSPTNNKKYLEVDLNYIKARWDNRADRWDEDLKDMNSHLNRDNSYERFFTIFDSILYNEVDLKNKSFLDLACGTGALLERYCFFFKQSIGVDISEKMLLKAKEKNLVNTKLIKKDCFHFFDEKMRFDYIASRGVLLSHYGEKNSILLLSDIYKSLNKNGILFIDALNIGNQHNPKCKTLYNQEQLCKIFNNSGFSNIKIYVELNYPLLYIKAQK